MKTIDDILNKLEKSREKVRQRTNDRVEILNLTEAGISLDKVSEFIEKCWHHDYGDEPRITFNYDFLQSNGIDSRNSLIAEKNGHIIGCTLNLDRQAPIDLKWGISTGISVAPESRGKGIGQLMHYEQMKCLSMHDLDFNAYWFDTRHEQDGSSYSTFGRTFDTSKEIWIMAKSLDYNQSNKVTHLNLFEKLSARLIDYVFPARYVQLPKDETVSTGSEIDTKVYDSLAGYEQIKYCNLMTLSSIDEIHASKNRICITYKKNEKVCAILFGYQNPVVDGEKYFIVDGLHFDQSLGHNEKSAFLRNSEHILKEDGCFSLVIPSNICEERLLKFGYFPLVKHVLCINYFTERVNPDMIENLRIELR